MKFWKSGGSWGGGWVGEGLEKCELWRCWGKKWLHWTETSKSRTMILQGVLHCYSTQHVVETSERMSDNCSKIESQARLSEVCSIRTWDMLNLIFKKWEGIMCSFTQGVTRERVNIVRLIKTDKLFWAHWKTLPVILLNAAWKIKGHMPNTSFEVISPNFFQFPQELKREQKMGFLQAMWCHPVSTCPSKLKRILNTRQRLCFILSLCRGPPNQGATKLIWHLWHALWQMKKCDDFYECLLNSKNKQSYWNIVFILLEAL